MVSSYLLLRIPQENNNNESASENFFSQLAEILKGKNIIVSSEIVLYDRFLWFFITCPAEIKNIIKGQWYSSYPNSEIEEITDYTNKLFQKGKAICGCELTYDKSELTPIKTYRELDKNPLAALAGIASSFGKEDVGCIQLVLKSPPAENLYEKFQKKMRQQRRDSLLAKNNQNSYLNLEEEKDEKAYFETTIRFIALSSSPTKAELNLSSMVSIYKKSLERPRIQKLKESRLVKNFQIAQTFMDRELASFNLLHKLKFRFSPDEIATIFHLPYKQEEISLAVQIRAKKAPPPSNLSVCSSDCFGKTNFQDKHLTFGILTDDRRRHLYVIGKTGMGKSKLLELLIQQDIKNNRGVILLDPHGDLAEESLKLIPDSRKKDVVYFNPADLDHPIGFNPMEGVTSFEFKQNIVAGFIAIFKKLFGLNWNERFEHVLRYTTLALLDYPSASILGIPKMLTDNIFRQEVINFISDPLVKKFWTTEFMSWNEQYANEAIVPIINKIGQFVANPMIRNIVGQAKTGFDLDEIMNREKILIANLSIGKLGEENSALLGAMLITKIWQTAMTRTTTPEPKRKDTFLYVDEFQNFATTAFANILSESRKYRLNLILAHQYMQQLPNEVRAASVGNVGNIISFRIGGDDAQILANEFAPVFTPNDFINLDMREFYIKMLINGQAVTPFSAHTLNLELPSKNISEEIIEFSQKQWAKMRGAAEKEIEEWAKIKIEVKIEKDENKFPEPII